jgi:hypothetical protein
VDRAALDAAFASERNTGARLAQAFALAALGNRNMGDLAPLHYLVSTFNQRSFRAVAQAFLIELAREPAVRTALYPALARATREEKIGLSTVFGASGGTDSVPYLEMLSMDPDVNVAAEGIRSLRILRARLP